MEKAGANLEVEMENIVTLQCTRMTTTTTASGVANILEARGVCTLSGPTIVSMTFRHFVCVRCGDDNELQEIMTSTASSIVRISSLLAQTCSDTIKFKA